MAKVEPLSKGEPVVLEFECAVDDAWVEHMIDTSGVKPPRDWNVQFDLREIDTPPLRRALREAYQDYNAWTDWFPVLPYPIEDAQEAAVALVEAVEAERRRRDDEAAAADAVERERQELVTAFEEDRGEWIKIYGSRRLQMAAARRYEINRLYAIERAALEFPGAWVDTGRDCRWRERANPTEDALLLEDAVHGHMQALGLALSHRVVWVHEWPRAAVDHISENTPYLPAADEALRIHDWLGRWDLFLSVDPDYRAPTAESDAEAA
jgi:hypothetical protein